MGKSQTKRLREATKRFGLVDRNRLARARAALLMLAYARKVEAGLIAPTVVRGIASNGPTLVKRYCSSFSYQQNKLTYGRPLK